MKAHRSLSRLDIVAKGPAMIALMIASEFSRAANRAAFRDNVVASYERARELCGILESLPLPNRAAHRLKPLVARMAAHQLYREERLTPARIERASRELVQELTNWAATA